MSKGTGMLRERNKRAILSLIRKQRETTRQDLADQTGLSKNTISLIVDEFLREKIVKEKGIKPTGTKGRPKIAIAMHEDGYRAIGIGISKRTIEYAVVNYYGEVLESQVFSFVNHNPDDTKAEIMKILEYVAASYNNILGAAIGMPGVVNDEKSILYSSTHLGWKDVSFIDLHTFTFPIYIQNNVNMGALNAMENAPQEMGPYTFYVSIGDGVGGTMMIDHYIVNGANGTAGEIGHIAVDPDGELCRCGQTGCLEVLINHEAMKNQHSEKGMHRSGQLLGKALVQVIHLFNPDHLLIDSSYPMTEPFIRGCMSYMEKNALAIPFNQAHVLFSEKKFSTSTGAGLYCILQHESNV
ncbi:ROK family transcriptional regulator [Geomicrobium sp. JCM 19039]|uniref:ROK family transcriptional regulator n=1 Tax=Geomicrobium sp. JCM 19039 TaxID=1460636 RepID=UPI00045F357D|nr:ROK family transcriptional regulator [Geomicrobium sp. JCM 19039]GAK14060.1 glucokinase [Geomicrobium sp. JCM 19039]